MTGSIRRGLAAGGAGVALLVVFMAVRDDAPGTAPAPRPARGAARASSARNVPVADLRLESLRSAPAELEEVERNLFRFGSRTGPPPAASSEVSTPGGRIAPPVAVAPGPPSVPPIPLRYIGLLDAPAQAGKVAILSDGRGNILYGKEGDIIEGRYVMLRVGPISADLSYLDGRGRETIRLSGQ